MAAPVHRDSTTISTRWWLTEVFDGWHRPFLPQGWTISDKIVPNPATTSSKKYEGRTLEENLACKGQKPFSSPWTP